MSCLLRNEGSGCKGRGALPHCEQEELDGKEGEDNNRLASSRCACLSLSPSSRWVQPVGAALVGWAEERKGQRTIPSFRHAALSVVEQVPCTNQGEKKIKQHLRILNGTVLHDRVRTEQRIEDWAEVKA